MTTPAERSPWFLLLQRQPIFLVFLLFLIVLAFFSPRFLSWDNLITVLRQVSVEGVMALGMTFVLVVGEIDLSVGSLLSLTTVLVVNLHDRIGPVGAIGVAISVGILSGSLSGFLVGYLGLNSLIATLGMLSALQGLTLLYSGGQNVIVKDPNHTWFAVLGRGFIGGLPVPVILFFGFAILLSLILNRTVFGTLALAVGGNPVASRYSGIHARAIKFWAFVLSGAMTGVGAVMLGSRVMGSQNQVGQGYELQVIAAVVLGGTSLFGGSGSIWRTVIGVLILGFLRNGLLLVGLHYYDQWLVTWAVLIAAVWLDLASQRRRLFA
jgi:ribose transport system permease protein